MKFFCSKDCPDFCNFDIERDMISKLGIRIKPYKKYFINKAFTCSKLKDFYKLDVKNDDKSFYLDKNGYRVYSKDTIHKLIDFLGRNKEKKILLQRGSGSIGYYMSYWDMLFSHFQNCFFVKGSPCDESGILAHKEDFGVYTNPDIRNLEKVKNILLFGKNAKVTSPHLYAYLKQLKSMGKTIIDIDPIMNETADIATKYIRINPATDGILAFALLLKMGYIRDNVNIDALLGVIGININDFLYLVDSVIQAKTAIIEGMGMQRYSNGKNSIQWVDRLAFYTDNIDNLYYGRFSKEAFEKPQINKPNIVPITCISDYLNKDFFDIVVVVASNPVITYPDSDIWYEALKKCKTVVIGTHIDQTASIADYFIRVGGMFAQDDLGGSYFFHEEAERERFVTYLDSDINIIKRMALGLGINFNIVRREDIQRIKGNQKREFNYKNINLMYPYFRDNAIRLISLSNVSYLNSQRLHEGVCEIYISKELSLTLDLLDGDCALLENKKGSFRGIIRVSNRLSGSLYVVAYKGISNSINSVTESKPTDAEFAFSYYDTFVNITKCT